MTALMAKISRLLKRGQKENKKNKNKPSQTTVSSFQSRSPFFLSPSLFLSLYVRAQSTTRAAHLVHGFRMPRDVASQERSYR